MKAKSFYAIGLIATAIASLLIIGCENTPTENENEALIPASRMGYIHNICLNQVLNDFLTSNYNSNNEVTVEEMTTATTNAVGRELNVDLSHFERVDDCIGASTAIISKLRSVSKAQYVDDDGILDETISSFLDSAFVQKGLLTIDEKSDFMQIFSNLRSGIDTLTFDAMMDDYETMIVNKYGEEQAWKFLAASSTAKYSYAYWTENAQNWILAINTARQNNGLPPLLLTINPGSIGHADVAGLISGAIVGGTAGYFGGPGGVIGGGAMGGAIGAVGCSAGEFAAQVWDEWF